MLASKKHQSSVLLVRCEGNPPVAGGKPVHAMVSHKSGGWIIIKVQSNDAYTRH